MHELDLRYVYTGLIGECTLAIFDCSNGFVNTCGIDNTSWLWFVSNWGELEVFEAEWILWVLIFWIILIQKEFPGVYITIPTSRNESPVIIEPLDASNRSMMCLVYHFLSVLTGVELVDIDVILGCASKQVTSIWESNLSATFNSNCLKWLKAIFENIHHSNSICETNYYVESCRVECYTIGLIAEQLTNFKLKLARCLIVPNSNGLIDRTSSYQVLFNANIHTLNRSGVEWEDGKLIFAVIVRPIDRESCFHNLVIFSGKNNHVISWRQGHAFDATSHYTRHQLMIIALIIFVTLLW